MTKTLDIPIAAEWERFTSLSDRVSQYLKSSEAEFGALIVGLDAWWSMTEEAQATAAALSGGSGPAQDSEATQSFGAMLEECDALRRFVGRIQAANTEMASSMEATRDLIGTVDLLQAELSNLTYLALSFRVEGARLHPPDNASIGAVADQMSQLHLAMKKAGESQHETLASVLDIFSKVTFAIEDISGSAKGFEGKMRGDLQVLVDVPPDLLQAEQQTAAVERTVAEGVRKSLRMLQGHDAIRQRLEHVLSALVDLREGRGLEPAHTLMLQREQAKQSLNMIVETQSAIQRQLASVIEAADGGNAGQPAQDRSSFFERAVDRIEELNAETSRLLTSQITIGDEVLAQLKPVGGLLSSTSHELESQARNLQWLALNARIAAEHIPSAKGVSVLGSWTSEIAETMLQNADGLSSRFNRLTHHLEAQAGEIQGAFTEISEAQEKLLASSSSTSLRNSRRAAYEKNANLLLRAAELRNDVDRLMREMQFADEGSRLLQELDAIMTTLLLLYPASESPLELEAHQSGYTMKEQYEAHAKIFGIQGSGIPGDAEVEQEATPFVRLSEANGDEDYGDNVELF